MVARTLSDRPRMVEIVDVRGEAPNVKTALFNDGPCSKARPGQFAMVWAPGLDEMPMSLSVIDPEGPSGITVKPWGAGSRALCRMGAGDLIGVRGPYGRGFVLADGSVLLVGGGTGLAPLMPLSEALVRRGTKVILVMAGRTEGDLPFLDRAEANLLKEGQRVIIATDDGSYGLKGYAGDIVSMLLQSEGFDMIYTGGPEAMMKEVFLLAEGKGIPLQASLERVMKCANGLCGSCGVGGYLVCRDGPVFGSERLREVGEEFGSFFRDASGRPVKLEQG